MRVQKREYSVFCPVGTLGAMDRPVKTLTPKIKYLIEGDTAYLYARPKTGRIVWTRFASCHPATIAEMKAKGFDACKGLIRVLPQFPNVSKHCAQ